MNIKPCLFSLKDKSKKCGLLHAILVLRFKDKATHFGRQCCPSDTTFSGSDKMIICKKKK